MKKIRIAVFLTAFLLVLAGCAKENAADVDPVQLADDLKASLIFQDEMTAASDSVRDKLYNLSGENLSAGRVYLSTVPPPRKWRCSRPLMKRRPNGFIRRPGTGWRARRPPLRIMPLRK